MNPAYRAYFRNRLDQMQADDLDAARGDPAGGLKPDPRAPFFAQAAIDHARRELPDDVELRADAEMLLYLLASEFVAKPVLMMDPGAGIGLAEAIAEDTAHVLGEAVKQARGSGSVATSTKDAAPAPVRAEVSAHDLVDGLSRSWERLRTADYRVWDRSTERGADASGKPGRASLKR